jgi:hypothetical protein
MRFCSLLCISGQMSDLDKRMDPAPEHIPLPEGGYKPVWKFKESPKIGLRTSPWALYAIVAAVLALAVIGAVVALGLHR